MHIYNYYRLYAKSEGEEIGADFILQGSINTITDRIEGKSVKYYQVNLELINIETNKKVWTKAKNSLKSVIKLSILKPLCENITKINTLTITRLNIFYEAGRSAKQTGS